MCRVAELAEEIDLLGIHLGRNAIPRILPRDDHPARPIRDDESQGLDLGGEADRSSVVCPTRGDAARGREPLSIDVLSDENGTIYLCAVRKLVRREGIEPSTY